MMKRRAVEGLHRPRIDSNKRCHGFRSPHSWSGIRSIPADSLYIYTHKPSKCKEESDGSLLTCLCCAGGSAVRNRAVPATLFQLVKPLPFFCPTSLHAFAIKTYGLTGDVSVRVQIPETKHLVPSLFDGRMCFGPAGATKAYLGSVHDFA